jgi:hypothetical protein
MNHRAWSICFVVIASLGTLPGLAARDGKRPRSVLDDVAALDRHVTYTETKMPLGELVQKVAEDTGAPLTAAADVADEPVAVVVKAFSARELLVQLADLLDYTWSRRGKAGAWRYEIYQDLGGKQREEALRRAVHSDIVRRLRHDLGTAVELAALTPEQLQRVRDDWRKRSAELGKLPAEQREAATNSPEVLELRWRAGLTQYVSTPFARTLARLVGGLTDSQWDRLQSGQMLVFSTDPLPGELRLPGETAGILRTTQPALFDAWIKRPLDAAEEQRQNEMREQWSAATGYRVTVSIRAPAGGGGSVCARTRHQFAAMRRRGRAGRATPSPGARASISAPRRSTTGGPRRLKKRRSSARCWTRIRCSV